MQREKTCLARIPLILLSTLVAASGLPVKAQGIGEYGGLMGMPRPVPTGHASALQNLYGVPSLMGGSQPSAGVGSSGLPFVGDSRIIAKNVADKANAYFQEAQKKEKAGKLAEAEALYRSSAAWRERVWGSKDPAVYVIYGRIAILCRKQNKFPEAEAAFRRQVTCGVKLYGAGAFELCPALNDLGDTLMAQNKHADSITTYRQVYQLRKRKLGGGNAETLAAMLKLAKAMKQNGDAKDAEALAKEGSALAQVAPEHAALLNGFSEIIGAGQAGQADQAAANDNSSAPPPDAGVAAKDPSGSGSDKNALKDPVKDAAKAGEK